MGHIRQSLMMRQILLTVRPSRLCMLDFDGSSLRTRLTMMVSSLVGGVSRGAGERLSTRHTAL